MRLPFALAALLVVTPAWAAQTLTIEQQNDRQELNHLLGTSDGLPDCNRLYDQILRNFCFQKRAMKAGGTSAPVFSDYPVTLENNNPTAPDFSTPGSYDYRTRIKLAAQAPANFGGHFNIVEWGCGTDCTAGAIIEKFTGSVIMLPVDNTYWENQKYIASGFQYLNSSMLLVMRGQVLDDPQSKSGIYYYIVADNSLKLLKFTPSGDAVPNGQRPSDAIDLPTDIAFPNNNINSAQAAVSPPDQSAAPPPSTVAPVSEKIFGKDDIQAMVSTYTENQIRFARDYKGRSFQSDMPFFKASKSYSGGFDVSFGGGVINGDAECVFRNLDDLTRMAEWRKGQIIRLTGRIDDVSFGTVNLIECNAQSVN